MRVHPTTIRVHPWLKKLPRIPPTRGCPTAFAINHQLKQPSTIFNENLRLQHLPFGASGGTSTKILLACCLASRRRLRPRLSIREIRGHDLRLSSPNQNSKTQHQKSLSLTPTIIPAPLNT